VFSVPVDSLKEEVARIHVAMQDMTGFDVPMRVDTEYGHNWHDLTPDPLELFKHQHV
jgi:DNA polymerase I-like protein with 3'-5' exonuclease and polymerase domains